MAFEKLRPTDKGPVKAEMPKSAGPLFPEKEELSTDPRFAHAGEFLASLMAPDAFRIHPSLKTAESRPFGAYPGEGSAYPVDGLLDEFNGFLKAAHAGAVENDLETSLAGLEGALAAIHKIGKVPTDDTVAPLHAWLPDRVDEEVLSRLTFSYAELTADDADQRKLLHYLDLLLENLPDPLKGHETSPRQRLLRMFALIYTGRALDKSRTVQEAIKHYEEALTINDIHTPGIEEARLIAYAELINLHFKRAYKLSAEKKIERFMGHANEIVSLRESIEKKLSAQTHREALIVLRQDLARRFWHLGLVDSAYQELLGIQTKYGSDQGHSTFLEIVSNSGLPKRIQEKIVGRFSDGKALVLPEDLAPLSPATKAWLWATQAIKNAARPKTWNTVKNWAGGAALTAGAVYALSGGDATATDLLMAAGTGAAALDGAARIAKGIKSPRTEEAVRMGLDDVHAAKGLRYAAGFAANTLLPYTIMGGQVPLLGLLDSAPVLGGFVEPAIESVTAAGSVYGPGALVTGSIDAVFNETAFIANALRDGSTLDAASTYANHIAGSQLGSTVTAAYSSYSNVVTSMLDGTLGTRIATSLYSAATSDAPNVALNAFKASSLLYYAIARNSPRFVEMTNKGPYRAVGPAMAFGGALLFADIGAFLGAEPGYVDIGLLNDIPLNALGIAATGAGLQVLSQKLNGMTGKGFTNLQWYNVIGAAAIISGYVGASNNFAPAHESVTMGEMIQESVGRQIGLTPVIAAHAAMVSVNARRFTQNKLARLLFWDHFGNVSRIALGSLTGTGWSGFLPVLVGVSISFGITNSILGRTFNDQAGSKAADRGFANGLNAVVEARQRLALAEQAVLLAQGSEELQIAQSELMKAAKALEKAQEGTRRSVSGSLRRLPAAPQLTKMSPETLTLPVRAFYHSLIGKRLASYMLPEQLNYRILSDRLMSEPDPQKGGLTGEQVDTLLSVEEKFLENPDDVDVARGLGYIFAASKGGPHGERIQAFLNANRDIYARLRIDRETEPLPEGRGAKEQKIMRVLRHPYRVCPEEHLDTMEQAHASVDQAILARQLGTAGMMGAGISLMPFIHTTPVI